MFIIREGQETPGFWNAFDWKDKSDIENKENVPEIWVRVISNRLECFEINSNQENHTSSFDTFLIQK